MRKGLLQGAVLLILGGKAAFAQTVGSPAEAPPAGYSAREYVDSKGCAFQRATVSGSILWVPRLTAENQPVCNKVPTLGASVTADGQTTKIETPTKPVSANTKHLTLGQPTGNASGSRARAYGEAMLVEREEVRPSETLCLSADITATRLWLSDGRRITHCGLPIVDPVLFLNSLGLPDLKLLGTDYSTFARDRARQIGKRGYRVTWSSGAIRDQRPDAPVESELLWVQVGAFADPQNADRAIGNIRRLDLPIARQKVKGGRLTAVLAGPFATRSAALQALATLQRSGFPEAFFR